MRAGVEGRIHGGGEEEEEWWDRSEVESGEWRGKRIWRELATSLPPKLVGRIRTLNGSDRF